MCLNSDNFKEVSPHTFYPLLLLLLFSLRHKSTPYLRCQVEPEWEILFNLSTPATQTFTCCICTLGACASILRLSTTNCLIWSRYCRLFWLSILLLTSGCSVKSGAKYSKYSRWIAKGNTQWKLNSGRNMNYPTHLVVLNNSEILLSQ